MASSPLDPRHVAPPPPETRRPCRLQRFLKDWEVGNELLILGVIALCVGLSLVATSGPITRSIWFPAMLAGAAIILVRVAVASLRSWPWARGLGIAGLALFALDLGGCTIRPGILLPLWAPFLGIALLGVIAQRRRRALRGPEPHTDRAPLASRIRSARRTASERQTAKQGPPDELADRRVP